MSTLAPRPGILDITPYVGGGSTAPAAAGGRISRLASNESPLGPSPRAVEAYRHDADALHRYPDGGAGALRAALAERHGIDAGASSAAMDRTSSCRCSRAATRAPATRC